MECIVVNGFVLCCLSELVISPCVRDEVYMDFKVTTSTAWKQPVCISFLLCSSPWQTAPLELWEEDE